MRHATRKFMADTVALIVFSTVAGLGVELLVAGMTLAQSAQARLTAVPVMLLTARPYGAFRDWVIRTTSADRAGQLGLTLADVSAFVSFQLPLYVVILLAAGATIRQVAAACGSALVILAIAGRPYGIFLELCRRLFGLRDSA